jgi:hypothetical protein
MDISHPYQTWKPLVWGRGRMPTGRVELPVAVPLATRSRRASRPSA